MSHFALIDANNTVVEVIVAEQDFIDSGAVGDPSRWIQTSYNTRGGVHYGPDGQPDGGVALRANYAVVGGTYDPVHDVFYGPKPVNYPSYVIGAPDWQWKPPIPKPQDGGDYRWDESAQRWVLRQG